MAIGDFFKNLFARSNGDDRIAAYVIREHDRGRPLAEILEDRYVLNRCSPQQIGRLLEQPEVIRALGEDTVASARGTVQSRADDS